MKCRTLKIKGLPLFGLIGIGVLLLSWTATSDQILEHTSLRSLEYRALLAQSLVDQIDELTEETTTLRESLREMEDRLSEARTQLDSTRTELDRLRDRAQNYDHEIERRDRLLAVFRSGAFEYYEVREGDTLASIAANPMVYGDAERSIWLEQANDIQPGTPLVPGMVLTIPRFPEGIQYDL